MTSKLTAVFLLNKDVSDHKDEIVAFFDRFKTITEKRIKQQVQFNIQTIAKSLKFDIILSSGYPHGLLFQFRNEFFKQFGKEYSLSIKGLSIYDYEIEFELEKEPLKTITIPYVDELMIKERLARIKFNELNDEGFIRKDYINRIVKRIKEKIEHQYYEGKAEFSEVLWQSGQKQMVWNKDPSNEMLQKGWIQQAKTKGKWFFGPQLAKIIGAMEKIVLDEVLVPLGFKEVMEPHHEAFSTLLKTGHLEGIPMELYYICEPKTRTPEDWERFIDYLKITKEVPKDELEKMLSPPNATNCYVQCPNIYEFFAGKTVADSDFPILVFDRSAVSNRYESGGRHGIERMDEFHRIEIVYIGTKEQLIEVKEKIIDRYKYIFNEILDLEWRMSWVTPFYMQHSGLIGLDDADQRIKGTIDFETYLPYRGPRETSEWLEFQNLSIVGDKYIKAFNIKAQRLDLWSGCSGVGLERWTVSFLAQKGLDPANWPEKFKKIVGDLPEQYTFY